MRLITGNAPWCVLYCQQYQPAVLPYARSLTQHYQYSWAVMVTCETCKEQGNVCTVCDSIRKKVALYNHHYKKHRWLKKKGSATIQNDEALDQNQTYMSDEGFLDDFSGLDVVSESEVLDGISVNLLQYTSPLPPTFDYFTSQQSQLYFKQQNAGLGAAYLVAKTQFAMPSVAARLDSIEVSFRIKLASLICTLTRHHHDQLAVLFDDAGKILLKQEMTKSCESNWFTNIPRIPKEMRSLYMKGMDALIPNLPRPTVQLIQEHAYVSLRDCVADLLGHGFNVDNIAEVGTDHVEEV